MDLWQVACQRSGANHLICLHSSPRSREAVLLACANFSALNRSKIGICNYYRERKSIDSAI
jgi:hypothetical protein